MSIKKIGAILLSLLLCLSAAGCGKEKEPGPSELQTPQYILGQSDTVGPPSEEDIHTSDQGVKVIERSVALANANTDDHSLVPAVAAASLTPETIWENDAVVSWNAFTLPEKAAFDDGSIGVLSISKIGLTVKVYESDDAMEDMAKGLAHFKSTSAWDGNVGISGHNSTISGSGAYFRDLHQLGIGDIVNYQTALGERAYKITAIKTIGDEDWSCLSRTALNQLTLITCVNNNAAKRLLVQGIQV